MLQYKTIVYTAFDADFAHTRGIKTRLVNYIMTFFVATAVVLTIRLVGIMLLISILSLPQMIAELFCHKFRNIVWLSGAINLLCGIGGLLLSYWLDVPAGATIVFTLIIAYFVVKIIASYLHSATGNSNKTGKIQFKKWSIIPITSIEKKNTTYYRFIYCSYTRILFHEKEYGGDTFLP